MHVAAVQFPDPAVTIAFDTDSSRRRPRERKCLPMQPLTATGSPAAHLSFPGIGHLRSAGTGYDYVPANYSALH